MTNTNSVKPHIVIIEDNVPYSIFLADTLEADYRVSVFGDAENLYESLPLDEADLILLDVRLGVSDGLELLARIRETYSEDDLAVIVISALDNPLDIVKGLETRANDYLTKPIDSLVLKARIRTQLKILTLQRENKAHIQELERTEQLRQRLSRIASHDLKNPINNLRIAEGLLREEMHDHSPHIEPLLKTMGASLDMMETVVEAFLDMIAIQTNQITIKRTPIVVKDLVNHAYAQYELAAHKKSIAMQIGNVDGIIIGDGGRMAQIIGNLVSNAIKFSPPGSTIEICTAQHGDTLRINVKDEGTGVPETERNLLFQEFKKLSPRPTAGEPSTGLGLWIVKHLIELQGGTVGADFPDDGGSIFWVEMPLESDHAT